MPNQEEAPVSTCRAKLGGLRLGGLRVEQPRHVYERQLVALVVAHHDPVPDLVRPGVPVGDHRGVRERGRRGVRDLRPGDGEVGVDLHRSCRACTSSSSEEFNAESPRSFSAAFSYVLTAESVDGSMVGMCISIMLFWVGRYSDT